MKQLSCGTCKDGLIDSPSDVVEKYKKAELCGFASGNLTFHESCDIMLRYISNKAKTFIFIDALDECNETSKHALIQAVKNIMGKASASQLKILISSRDELRLPIYFDFRETFQVHVETHRNQQDIDKYVDQELQQLIRQKRILVGGSEPSVKLQHYISAILCAQAQGM